MKHAGRGRAARSDENGPALRSGQFPEEGVTGADLMKAPVHGDELHKRKEE